MLNHFNVFLIYSGRTIGSLYVKQCACSLHNIPISVLTLFLTPITWEAEMNPNKMAKETFSLIRSALSSHLVTHLYLNLITGEDCIMGSFRTCTSTLK